MNTHGKSSQQQKQSGGWQPQLKGPSPSRTAKRSAKRPHLAPFLHGQNPLQNQAQLHKIMSLFQ